MRASPGLSSTIGLVLFDCDGVLVDSERLAVQVEVAVLGSLGWEISPEEVVERFLGVSDADYLAQIEEHLGITLPEGWLEEMEPRYRHAFERELTVVPGILSALERIEEAGIMTAVASSGSPAKLRFTLSHTGLFERFEGRVFSAVEVTRGKPAPDLFLHAAAALGVDPARTAVVEDSPAGIEAALAAGMRTVAYAGGGLVPPERLSRPGVTVITDMSHLPDELLGSTAR
ncbi:MAG TPA: HAD family phosphatase [Acidimicrobiales bacterium]|nr:HAD family phosphatase [Acidimicrobiales bacterium]